MKTVVVREYAQLFVQLETEPTIEASLDLAGVTPTAFDWLCQLQARFSAQGAQLLQLENRRSLRLDSYVGVVQTPCGTVLEIANIISSILAEQSEKKNSWLESSAGVGIAQTVRPTRLRGGGSKKKKSAKGIEYRRHLKCIKK